MENPCNGISLEPCELEGAVMVQSAGISSCIVDKLGGSLERTVVSVSGTITLVDSIVIKSLDGALRRAGTFRLGFRVI